MKTIKLLTILIAFSSFHLANAATATAPMQVTATVDPKCTITISDIAFGTVQLNSTNPSVMSSFTAQCTNGTTYNISFDGGLNASSYGYRLKHATLSEYLSYTLTIPSTGPVNPNQTAYSGTGNGSLSSVIIQGSLNTSANVTPGKFSDTVTVTVTY
jgi:spore coat protein U-like protein